MAQKKDLNISPYYDDYDPSKNFYKVLFKPGFPVQARELTTLQSILQNQVEQFGSHVFKEGSIVIPGGITVDYQYNSVKLSPLQFGIDVSIYADQLVGKVIEGRTSGVTATVDKVVLPDGVNVTDLTIYVKYIDSSPVDFQTEAFTDGEALIAKENIVYGNTTIATGQEVATLVSTDATSVGSACSVADGVYFIRGTFVNVTKQTIILDYYTNTPSYRVGLKIDELIIGAKDDPSLYDNAQGFTNYAAPGADRFKIALTLTKKATNNYDDSDFVEIVKVVNGETRKITTKNNYNIIKDYIAERTFEESGNYTLSPFDISVDNSLNDRLGNGGIFFSDEQTEQGAAPSDDLACVKIGGGTAYVHGYDIDTDNTTILDVPKPRETETIETAQVPFKMGNRLQLNSVAGQPQYRKEISLYNGYSASTLKIGRARVYSLSLDSNEYTGSTSKWNLYLYDVQTFTRLALNRSLSGTEVLHSYHVKGANSGATGYVWNSGGAGSGGTSSAENYLFVEQTSGRFLANEPLIIQGNSLGVQTVAVKAFGIKDVKYVKQTAAGVYAQDFTGFAFLEKFPFPNGVKVGIVTNAPSAPTLRSPGGVFTGISTNSVVRYAQGDGDEIFATIDSISGDGTTISLASLGVSVAGIFTGTPINTSGTVDISIGAPSIKDNDEGSLFTILPDNNISSLDLTGSTLTISAQITGEGIASSTTTLSIDGTPGVKDGSGVAIATAFFDSYSPSRYSIHYGSTTGVGSVTSGNFSLNSGGSEVVITGLNASDSNTVANVTATKQGIQSKVKNYVKSNILDVTLSKLQQSGIGTGIQDGLTWNKNAYGLRVQDQEISLNVPDVVKVLSVYESTGETQPTFDNIVFGATAAVASNAVIGEHIIGETSNAIARVVTNNGSTPSSGGTNKLGVVYLNDRIFELNENVKFDESNITTTVEGINTVETDGKYQNVTKSFTLDKGQRDQFYDYSRLVRKSNSSIPSKRLLIVFDKYVVPASDKGDAFTVMSYDKARYSQDIPEIGNDNVRATDTLDFRPRVPDFSSNTVSPFAFDSRTTQFNTTPKFLVASGETSILGYDYYLGRIDKLFIDKNGILSIQEGTSARIPLPPSSDNNSMELATLIYPPYLFDPEDTQMYLTDNKRYTMRDIGVLEDRIDSLERITTLSLLEVSTEALKVQDAQGNDRFKSGFFVDDFKNNDLIDLEYSAISVDENLQAIRPIIGQNSLESYLMPSTSITDQELDTSEDFALLDSNVVKRGNSVLLDYDEVEWINQPLATRVENVNPFHVIAFDGIVELTPASDSWVRTIRLNDSTTRTTQNRRRTDIRNIVNGRNVGSNFSGGGFDFRGSTTSRRTEVRTTTEASDVITSTGDDRFMRSRNTAFDASLLRPTQRHYQFFDGQSGVDFIPKLLEIANSSSLDNSGSVGTFQVGETVKGYDPLSGKLIITFRVAASNHKTGPFGSPKTVYSFNPYKPAEGLQSVYTSSSKILNVDVKGLAAKAQGLYSGYVLKGSKLVGQTSGAVSYVKKLRLISDNYGDLKGSWFLRDPFVDPRPSVTIRVGRKSYRLTQDKNNKKPLKGSKLISSAETNFRSQGRFREIQLQTTITTIRTQITTITRRWEEDNGDPLAQSFIVAANIPVPDASTIQSANTNLDDDQHGAFLTSVDLFFGRKPPTGQSNPCIVQIRTMELGTPTLISLNAGEVLYPDDITTSNDGTVATNVKFKEPIYLEAGGEYAVVLLSETSDQYEVWIARMGEKVVGGASGDGVGGSTIIYTQQWALGSLFKSQNGSIWSPSQMEDMKMKLYKARFTPSSGTAYFSNPTLAESNDYIPVLDDNPITTIAKSGKISITNLASAHAGLTTFVPGTKIVGSTNDAVHAYIVGTGASVTNASLTSGGSGYNNTTSDVSTFNIIGNGEGFKIKIDTVDANGAITGIITAGSAKGYKVGDVVGIVTADVAGDVGTGALLTVVENSGLDTLYLSGIQGTSATGSFKDTEDFRYVDPISGVIQNASTGSGPVYTSDLIVDGAPYDGKHFLVSQFDHGMHATNNKLELFDIEGNSEKSTLSLDLAVNASSISVGSTVGFSTFEGAPIGVGSTGYVRIQDEIIGYRSVGNGTLDDLVRGVDSTLTTPYSSGDKIEKYELNGVSLRRINTTHQISPIDIGLNSYYVGFNTTSGGKTRNVDAVANPELSFTETGFAGGDVARATRNIQFEQLTPCYNLVTPSPLTSVKGSIRTVTGTSVDGNEISFQDKGFQPVEINSINTLTTPRLVCSKINETTYLGNIERNKSFTTGITLSTQNQNVSPIIYTDVAYTQFGTNMIDKPVSDYATNAEVKTHTEDPHSAIYVSQLVKINKAADGLKVIVSAYRDSSADFRVLYALERADSMGVLQEFELFPGYDNLKDTTGDGFGNQVVDSSKNSGLPDSFVTPSLDNQYKEYQFTAENLGEFAGYVIKIVMSSTNQAYPVIIKDLRTIAIK